MKASKFINWTLREAPNDAVISSHQLMMRAGLIRKLGNGLYSYMPMGLKAFRKVEKIIREELDRAGMLEMKPTVVQPGEIWKESGRWEKMGPEMLKPQNCGGQDMVISPTAEEAFTALVRDGVTSYKQLPFTAYQINTKYRDEIRPRYGVMRGREFTMMDAYSFDIRYKQIWDMNWKESDDFFYDNPDIADKYGLVTYLDGKPVGFVTWDPCSRPEYVEIGHNGIREHCKGRGYGRLQLEEAIRRITTYEELKRIIVRTNSNLIAPKNYESAGFVLYDRKLNDTESAFAGDYLYYEMIL